MGSKFQNSKFDKIIILNKMFQCFNFLAPFRSVFHLFTPWKRPKTKGLLTSSRGIEKEHWAELAWETTAKLFTS